jgi:hypothetical protein
VLNRVGVHRWLVGQRSCAPHPARVERAPRESRCTPLSSATGTLCRNSRHNVPFDLERLRGTPSGRGERRVRNTDGTFLSAQ